MRVLFTVFFFGLLYVGLMYAEEHDAKVQRRLALEWAQKQGCVCK